MIVANGPLDGPPVESDAEILATWGDGLSHRDKLQFGWIDPDESTVTTATRTGVIGGGPPKPLPIRPDAIIPPLGPLHKPPRASRFDCLAFGANEKHANLVDGSHVSRPFACRECQPCREWRVFKLMVRYRHLATTESEAVIASACLTVDEAREWASKQGRRVPGPRVTILRRSSDYRWSAWVIYANGITKPEAALTTGNIIRAPTPDEFLALVPREPCAEGPDGVSRRTCLFTDWPDYETEPSDYLEDDGYIETGILQTKSEPSPLPGWALVRSHLPLEERAALNAGEWCEVATLADYIGPSALISDTRDWADGKAAWREAYRPMYWLLFG